MTLEKIDAENKEAIFQALVDTVGESISVLTKIDLESTMLYLAGCLTVAVQEKMLTVASFPLPKDHWLYAPREYDVDAENPKELPSPILTHALRAEVVSAIRYAIRGATMCGKETDFDPDALVQNVVYALCGPYGSAALTAPAQPVASDINDIVAGAIFDFMGYLTTRDELLKLSAFHEAGPAVAAIEEWAEKAGLSLENASVRDWKKNIPASSTGAARSSNKLPARN